MGRHSNSSVRNTKPSALPPPIHRPFLHCSVPRGAAPGLGLGDPILPRSTAESAGGRPPIPCCRQTVVFEHRNVLRHGGASQPSADRPDMSMSGSGGKRAGRTPTAAEPSPKRRRPRRLPPLSHLPPPNHGSPSSPSYVHTSPPYDYSPPPSPYRSLSPSPCRSWSQRQPSYDDDSDDQRRSRSRSRGSEETDGHGRSMWRPHSCRELGEGRGDGKFNVRISDYDLLFTCRSCHRMLSSPVYQCATGHVTCWKCHGEVGDNRCSFCGSFDGYGRSVAVEEFLHCTSFSCRNQEYGCQTFLPQNMMHAHEHSCRHEPCFCPVPRCGFASTTCALEAHLTGRHRWDMVKFRYGESFHAPLDVPAILRSKDDGELFHLDRNQEGRGVALSMICLRPDNARTQEFTYKLKMPASGQGGQHRLQMQSMVWNTSLRYGMGEAGRVFLMVPDELASARDIVEVCISKVSAGATSD